MLNAPNISTIPQRSPFRYPGGKTWLIPQIRKWLKARGGQKIQLLEPFAGGGIVTLTAVIEALVSSATMVELDKDVAAVWRTILGRNGRALARQILKFDFTEVSVAAILQSSPNNLKELAFQTLLKNRIRRNGILAAGAGNLKNGEGGYGLKSRWYPNTLSRRIVEIGGFKNKIKFECGDGLSYLRKYARRKNFVHFIDPPYNHIGRRLYRYGQIDHGELFRLANSLRGDFLMTYNKTDEVLGLAREYKYQTAEITMNGGLNDSKIELLIGRDLGWI